MKSVRSTYIYARDGGEVVVNAINPPEKRDVLKKAKTHFLSSGCVRVKLVAAVLEKTQQQQKTNANV